MPERHAIIFKFTYKSHVTLVTVKICSEGYVTNFTIKTNF